MAYGIYNQNFSALQLRLCVQLLFFAPEVHSMDIMMLQEKGSLKIKSWHFINTSRMLWKTGGLVYTCILRIRI